MVRKYYNIPETRSLNSRPIIPALQSAPILLSSPLGLLSLFAFHSILAIVMEASEPIASLHAIMILGIACFIAVTGSRLSTAYALMYIIGGELLWRMTGGNPIHEFGKYAVIAVATLYLVRDRKLKIPILMVYYCLAFVPAIAITLLSDDSLARARQEVSASGAGHLALIATGLFFSQLYIYRRQLITLFLAGLLPLAGVVTIVFYSLLTRDIAWNAWSNFAVVGDFGPNQVATILGLGAVWIVMILFNRDRRKSIVILSLALLPFLVLAGFLTFSRGGIVVGALAIAAFLIFRSSGSRFILALVIIIVLGAGISFMFQVADNISDNVLTERYTNIDLSAEGRILAIEGDLQTFRDHWLFGVGIGNVGEYHLLYLRKRINAHTEMTRLLAEQGLFGIVIMLILAAWSWRNIRNKPHASYERGMSISLIIWVFGTMLHSATRIVATTAMFSFTFINIVDDEVIDDDETE